MRHLFISDVHLRPGADSNTGRLEGLLRSFDPRGDRVHLLGDIFDYWIGPGHLDLVDYRPVIALFRELTGRGLAIDFIVGNRDYLVCRRFERETGIVVLGREAVLEIGGARCMLTHGDFLYNRNRRYAAYRRLMDQPWVSRGVSRIPPSTGGMIAKVFRAALGDRKPGYRGRRRGWTMERLIDPAKKIFAGGVDTLICGHVHQPCHQTFDFLGGERRLIVLGDWHADPVYAAWEGGRFALRTMNGRGS